MVQWGGSGLVRQQPDGKYRRCKWGGPCGLGTNPVPSGGFVAK